MNRRASAGRRVNARGCQSSASAQALATLLAAPGAIAFFDSEYGVDADSVGSVTMRIGGVLTASASKPARATLSPSGKRGITFTQASNQYLKQDASSIAAAIANGDYSALWVARSGGSAALRGSWGAGSSSGAAVVAHTVSSSNKDGTRRVTTAGGATGNTSTVDAPTSGCSVLTTIYDTTADTYDTWVSGATSLVAQANARDGTGADTLLIGGLWSAGVLANPSGLTIWGLIIATGKWTTAQRTSLEAAARIYWGAT